MRKPCKTVLLTGGAGYIGSHTYVALHQGGYKLVVLDDFSNSTPDVLDGLQQITHEPVTCVQGSVINTFLVQKIIQDYSIGAVIHFAGFKAVGESMDNPLKYYSNNIGGMVSLLQAMQGSNCKTLAFSSSATVYGQAVSVPITENFPVSFTNPYGQSKLVCEQILAAVQQADLEWRIAVLRYFNPAGAHPSGLIGEHPSGIPSNLMPYITQVALGQRKFLSIYGNDYSTPDGTGVRDYIHVQDLAAGHVAALQALLLSENNNNNSLITLNLGTGRGTSVLELVHTFEKATGQSIPYRFVPRRAGDVAQCYADASLAHRLLGWQATHTLADMCVDAWNWQKRARIQIQP